MANKSLFKLLIGKLIPRADDLPRGRHVDSLIAQMPGEAALFRDIEQLKAIKDVG